MNRFKMGKRYRKIRSLILFIFLCVIAIAFFSISMHFAHRFHLNHEKNLLRERLQTFELPFHNLANMPNNDDDFFSEEVYLPILMYHHIDDHPERFESGTITPERFAEDMHKLVELGFETIDTKAIRLHLEGKQRLPDRPILITIDDGYRSVYEHVFPVLQQYNLKAISTVIGSSIGRETHLFHGTPIIPHFSWEEAIEMSESGLVDIQSHSFDLHRPGLLKNEPRGAEMLADESEHQYKERFRKDTVRNERYIEEHLHNEVVLYAYPYGIYNEMTEDILKELGYIMTLTTEPGIAKISTHSEHLFILPRINMARFSSSQEAFQAIIRELYQTHENDLTDERSS